MILNVGATLACGTGACAVVIAAVLEGRAERVSIFFFLVRQFHFHSYHNLCYIFSPFFLGDAEMYS